MHKPQDNHIEQASESRLDPVVTQTPRGNGDLVQAELERSMDALERVLGW